jgi:hypothetical protein
MRDALSYLYLDIGHLASIKKAPSDEEGACQIGQLQCPHATETGGMFSQDQNLYI